MGLFFNPPPPLSPGFPEAQDPPSCLDFQDKRPPLPPGFPGKNIRLIFDGKYALSCLEDVLFLISKALAKLYQKFYRVELRKGAKLRKRE